MRRDVFQAIADPTRRDIMSMVMEAPKNLNSIAENFDMSRPAISQHIKLLEECGIITIEQKGRERFVYVQPRKMKEIDDWLQPFRRLWEERFDRLDNLLEQMKKDQNKEE